MNDLDSGKNVRYLMLPSIWVVGTDGRLKIPVTKNGLGNFTANYRSDMNFNKASIAYDLINPNSSVA